MIGDAGLEPDVDDEIAAIAAFASILTGVEQ